MPKYNTFRKGDVLGSYTLGKMLGDGRFGIVMEGLRDGQPAVAIKIPRHFDEAVESIQDEIKIMRSLQGCPHVISLVDVVEGKRGAQYAVMPVMETNMYTMLYELSKQERRMEVPLAKHYMRQMMVGMRWMHDHGFSNSDLKPENMLVNPGSHHLVLCDVGHSRQMEGKSSFPDAPQTTQNYRAVESILKRRPFTLKTDMWSVACVCYEILNNYMLFDPEFEETDIWSSDEEEDDEDDEDDEEEEDEEEEEEDQKEEPEEQDETSMLEQKWSSDDSESEEDEFEIDLNHLEQIMELLGSLSRQVRKQHRTFFNAKGLLRGRSHIEPVRLTDKLRQDNPFLSESQIDTFQDFLLPMLRYREAERSTPEDMLQHPWLASESPEPTRTA